VSHIEQLHYPDLTREPLWEDEFAVYAAAAHRLAKHKSLSLDELVEERWASTAAAAFGRLHRAFEDRGRPPPANTLVSESVMLRLRAVAGSNLLTNAPFSNKCGSQHKIPYSADCYRGHTLIFCHSFAFSSCFRRRYGSTEKTAI